MSSARSPWAIEHSGKFAGMLSLVRRPRPATLDHDRPHPDRLRADPAAWKETFASRDRRRFRVPWCICDECYQAATGEHTGNQYTMARANNLPLPKTAERIAEQSTSLTGRETKKEQGGDRGNQYTVAGGNNFPLPKTAERIAEQFNGPDRETKKEQGGDRGNQYTVAGGHFDHLAKTAERIGERSTSLAEQKRAFISCVYRTISPGTMS